MHVYYHLASLAPLNFI